MRQEEHIGGGANGSENRYSLSGMKWMNYHLPLHFFHPGSGESELSNYNTCKLSADIASLMSGELQTCLKSCRRKAASSTASAAKKSVIKMKNDI